MKPPNTSIVLSLNPVDILIKRSKARALMKLWEEAPNDGLCVRSLAFLLAWSDTCCVDKVNNVVLQVSLVAVFV